MFRSMLLGFVVAFCWVAPVSGQADASSLEGYFTGRMVVAEIDLPGTEKGVDLSFSKPSPMDWKEYSSRLTAFGIAIHKGEAARVTRIVLKDDHIEFHLNGGGFGAFGDDTLVTVSATPVAKSRRELELQKQVADARDPRQKHDLMEDLDRERSRRERMDASNRDAAMVASQMKAQQVADKRLRGGSRFNLRWKDSIPSDARTAETVMKLLANYVDFDASHARITPPITTVPAMIERPALGTGDASGLAQLRRGMQLEDVNGLFGQGRVVSQSVSREGLKTLLMEYQSQDSFVDVTCVEGVVVRYSINSK